MPVVHLIVGNQSSDSSDISTIEHTKKLIYLGRRRTASNADQVKFANPASYGTSSDIEEKIKELLTNSSDEDHRLENKPQVQIGSLED